MRIRIAVVIMAALLVGSTGWTQQKLGDVAGSIKLNPEAIVEKEGYVEDQAAAEKADHELFAGSLANCSAAAERVAELIDEVRESRLARNDPLFGRITAAAQELDTRLQDLALLRLTDRFREPFATAQEAADGCSQAAEALREEVAKRSAALSQSKTAIAGCRQQLQRAETQLAAVDDPEAGSSAEDEEPASARTDAEIVAAACEAERAIGEAAFDACESRQYRALAALSSRTPDNEMIDEAVFDGIRSICYRLHPEDFAAREQCELEKLTAARLEIE